jgi:hypothetical protein
MRARCEVKAETASTSDGCRRDLLLFAGSVCCGCPAAGPRPRVAVRGACLACEAVVSRATSGCIPMFCQRSMSGPAPAQERGMRRSLPDHEPCSPRPRKRGAPHGLRLMSSRRCDCRTKAARCYVTGHKPASHQQVQSCLGPAREAIPRTASSILV